MSLTVAVLPLSQRSIRGKQKVDTKSLWGKTVCLCFSRVLVGGKIPGSLKATKQTNRPDSKSRRKEKG